MVLSIITSIASATYRITNAISTIQTLIMKHLFTSTSNSPDSSYTTLNLANTNGFYTDGSVASLNCTGTSIGNYILNYTTLPSHPETTQGLTIMFQMKLTSSVTYSSNNTKYLIAQSRSETLEDALWTINLSNSTGTVPTLWFQFFPNAISGSGNNKVVNYYGSIASTNLAYDNTYHHYTFTIIPTNSTGNYVTIKSYKNGTLISTQATQGNTATNHFNNFLTMKRIEFFPSNFSIVGSPTVLTFQAAICRIADFRIYNKELTATEINICKTGGEISS